MTKIILDSTTDLLPEWKQEAAIVPLSIHFGDTEYLDGVNIDHRKFYELLASCETLPTTSQATPAAFMTLFEKIHQAGEQAVVLTLSSKLSGTYQSAVIAAQEYPEIQVVDSQSVAIGTGILARHAMDLAQAGMDAQHIALELLRLRERVRVVAVLDTLEYLKKGGRISKTAAIAGGLLSIKPVVAIENGEISLLGKARGSRQGNNLLVRQIEAAGGVDFSMPLLLGYTGLNEELLERYISDSAALWQDQKACLPRACIGSTVGTHVGPGAVAVAFYAAEHGKNGCTPEEPGV